MLEASPEHVEGGPDVEKSFRQSEKPHSDIKPYDKSGAIGINKQAVLPLFLN